MCLHMILLIFYLELYIGNLNKLTELLSEISWLVLLNQTLSVGQIKQNSSLSRINIEANLHIRFQGMILHFRKQKFILSVLNWQA
jgi:hypothetical protein